MTSQMTEFKQLLRKAIDILEESGKILTVLYSTSSNIKILVATHYRILLNGEFHQ